MKIGYRIQVWQRHHRLPDTLEAVCRFDNGTVFNGTIETQDGTSRLHIGSVKGQTGAEILYQVEHLSVDDAKKTFEDFCERAAKLMGKNSNS